MNHSRNGVDRHILLDRFDPETVPSFQVNGRELTQEEFEAKLDDPTFIEQAKLGQLNFNVKNSAKNEFPAI